MIITSTPFRISFSGGGSDISVFYRRHKGAVLSASINKYVYLSIHSYFNVKQTLLKYSQNELIDNVKKIKHPVFREVFQELLPDGGVEVVSTADIPSGTGLGSSSTFTVSLLQAVYAYRGEFCSKERLARKACEIEIEKLQEPIGKQDQYAAAYGGLNFIEFNSNESVVISPLILPAEIITQLENNLLLFYLGNQRSTKDILTDQNQQVSMHNKKFNNLKKLVDMAYYMREQLLKGDLVGFFRTMHEGWTLKKTLSHKITNKKIENYYDRALEYGALGGKLLGAGGGGFLLLYCEPKNQEKLRKALFDCFELPFKFDWNGSRVIYVGENHSEKGFIFK